MIQDGKWSVADQEWTLRDGAAALTSCACPSPLGFTQAAVSTEPNEGDGEEVSE